MVLSGMTRYRLYLLGGGGAASFMIGAVLIYFFSSIAKSIVSQQLQITEDSRSFEIWRDTPVPQEMSFYFYNWTNPSELNYEKAKFTQMGPYVFNVIERKTNLVWNANGTITFNIRRTWFFDEKRSNGALEDEVTTVNALAMSAANTIRHKDIILKQGLSTTMWITGHEVVIKKQIGDLLFLGYPDPLLKMAKNLPAFSDIKIPPFLKFAWFYERNGSDSFEGTFNMATGVDDIMSFGDLRNWNYGKATSFYDKPCSWVNGSAGELFPPERTKTHLEMFSSDLCRSIKLSYSHEDEIHGITGYKYIGDEYTFDNGTLDPSNKCFCDGVCSPSGVLNVTTCRFGAPGFISFPHYYLADPYFRNNIEGMNPRKEDHELYITVEPYTGIPLDVAARFQINIRVSKVEGIKIFEDMPTIYFPVFWFQQRVTITEELAANVLWATRLPVIIQSLGAFLVIVGFAIFAMTIYLYLQPKNREENQDIKLTETGEPLLNDNNKPQITQLKSSTQLTSGHM